MSTTTTNAVAKAEKAEKAAKAARRAEKRAEKMDRMLDEAEFDLIRAKRLRAANEVSEAKSTPLFTAGGEPFYLNATAIAKVVAVTGAVVVATAVAAWLVYRGARWLLEYITGSGEVGSIPISDEMAEAVL